MSLNEKRDYLNKIYRKTHKKEVKSYLYFLIDRWQHDVSKMEKELPILSMISWDTTIDHKTFWSYLFLGKDSPLSFRLSNGRKAFNVWFKYKKQDIKKIKENIEPIFFEDLMLFNNNVNNLNKNQERLMVFSNGLSNALNYCLYSISSKEIKLCKEENNYNLYINNIIYISKFLSKFNEKNKKEFKNTFKTNYISFDLYNALISYVINPTKKITLDKNNKKYLLEQIDNVGIVDIQKFIPVSINPKNKKAIAGKVEILFLDMISFSVYKIEKFRKLLQQKNSNVYQQNKLELMELSSLQNYEKFIYNACENRKYTLNDTKNNDELLLLNSTFKKIKEYFDVFIESKKDERIFHFNEDRYKDYQSFLDKIKVFVDRLYLLSLSNSLGKVMKEDNQSLLNIKNKDTQQVKKHRRKM